MSQNAYHSNGEVVHRLEASQVFDNLLQLGEQEGNRCKAYAHYLARACWHGCRIILRQTSPESEGIFDFILELHRACNGDWDQFLSSGVAQEHLDEWLEYSGNFLSSLGNHFISANTAEGDGDQKVVPNIPEDAIRRMSAISPEATLKLEEILTEMMAAQPSNFGYPSATSLSGYYPGQYSITKEEAEAATKLMETQKISPQNTRLLKLANVGASGLDDFDVFEILQASAEVDLEAQFLGSIEVPGMRRAKVFLRRGDHSVEMNRICANLTEAIRYAATDTQKLALSQLTQSFRTGNYDAFCAAQRAWVRDKAPLVEYCMGFLFGYRDPCGIRSEWQASAGIADLTETTKMKQLVEQSTEIIGTLPWAITGDNNGKGPFEPTELVVPDFAVIHVLASLSSTVWEATNITLDNTDGKRHGSKNMVFINRMNLNSRPGRPCYYVNPSESKGFMEAVHICRFISTATHELIGHGSGKRLTEMTPGKFNFDHKNLPISPITGELVKTWYGPGENWVSVFGKLARPVEECRAFLIATYLADNKNILSMFGYDEQSSPTADDLIYYTYLEVGVEGLRSLSSFNAQHQSWGGDHDRAKFAIFKHLLLDGDGFMSVEQDPVAKTLAVQVDKTKISTHGKPSIDRMLCKIHIWKSTADITACRPYFEDLSIVDGMFEKWKEVVDSNPEPKWKFVQPNTFMQSNGVVNIQEYASSNVGIIKSFFERDL